MDNTASLILIDIMCGAIYRKLAACDSVSVPPNSRSKVGMVVLITWKTFKFKNAILDIALWARLI